MVNTFRRMVLQPTSLCNLNCTYCYLADRDKNQKMDPGVAKKIAKDLSTIPNLVRIIWHGGEPLSCGINHFQKLLESFEPLRVSKLVKHSLQTNGTLINRDWCKLFQQYDIHISVSIDGPQWANKKRVDWSGKDSFFRIKKGILSLQQSDIPFTAICVAGFENLDHAPELYNFFSRLGCTEVGINIEEKQGVNNNSASDNENTVQSFWKELFVAWRKNPSIVIREFRRALQWMEAVNTGSLNNSIVHDLFPSIAHNGKVVLLSPEFLDAKSSHYNDFEAGNVCNEPLTSIVARGNQLTYVQDFEKGIKQCQNVCGYSNFCRGGQASNKYFELGSTNGTETIHCRNTEQRLIEGVLSVL